MKRLLITILVLITTIIAQQSYTDDSLLNIDYLRFGKAVITVPSGYTDLHEGSNIYEHEGQLIWMGTCVKDGKYSLHYWISEGDLEKWDYKGKIVIKDGGGRELEAEDAYVYFANGMLYISFENKTEEKEHGLFKISLASYAYSLSDTFWFLGGAYGLAQFGDGFAQDAIYSGCPLNDGMVKIFDGRKGRFEENIGIAYWDGSKYVPNAEPIFTVNDIDQPDSNTGIVLTTGIADDVYKLPNNYIMEIVAYKDWDYDKWLNGIEPNGYWCQGLAISDNLESGWEVLDSEIKNQHGSQTMFHLFYKDKWMALGSTLSEPNTIYLAEVITKTETEPPIPPQPTPDNETYKENIRNYLELIEIEVDKIQ